MSGILDMRRRFENLNHVQAAVDSLNATSEDLVILNRDQMYDGKRRDQQDISPSYLEDSYFKSREAAKRYSDWKDSITPNPKRKKGVANLFIVGTFHGTIMMLANGRKLKFSSAFPEAPNIEAKFTGYIYGVGGPYKAEYIREYLRPVYIKSMKHAVRL